MKCKVLCFLFCVLFCFSSLSLSSFAGDEPGYIFTVDDLLDLGFYLAPNGSYVYSGNDDPFDLGIETLIATEKNYPDFDVYEDIPWATFPGYIQDIVYMSLDGLKAVEGVDDGFIVPFVAVQVTNEGTVANVFVGTNVGLGFINNGYMSYSIFSYLGYSEIAQHSKLYRLRVDLSNGDIVDWTEYKGSAYGDTGSWLRMLSWNTGNDSALDDWYLYGANGISYNRSSLVNSDGTLANYSVIIDSFNSSDSNKSIGCSLSLNGFLSGNFLLNQDKGYPYTYFQYFEPPSRETLEQETSKGIWETLKGIPEAIGEKIKGLFVPATGFFDLYVQDFRLFFQDRLGLLYELPEAVIDIFQQLADYEPATEGYGIDFPEVVMPVLDNDEWYDKVLIEETRFEFDFLDEGPIATLYSMYRSALWLTFIFLLINLIIRKANKVFGGGSG